MMKVLREYELVSGQMINMDKNLFYLHEKTSVGVCNRMKRITEIKQGAFHFIYLGHPVFYG